MFLIRESNDRDLRSSPSQAQKPDRIPPRHRRGIQKRSNLAPLAQPPSGASFCINVRPAVNHAWISDAAKGRPGHDKETTAMTDFIKHLGLPVRYAFIGLLGGLIFLAIFSTTTSLNEIPWDSLAGIAFGASLGGCVLQALNRKE